MSAAQDAARFTEAAKAQALQRAREFATIPVESIYPGAFGSLTATLRSVLGDALWALEGIEDVMDDRELTRFEMREFVAGHIKTFRERIAKQTEEIKA